MRAWSAVALLLVVGIVNLADRFLPGILTEPIKHDLHLTDTAVGLINGFGFLIVYAVMGIPIARLADRGLYGMVIAACMATWSVMTMVGGLAQSGWQLALTRMGVAVGEAGSTPAAHAYISRNFAPDRRAAPLAVLTLSTPLAGTAGLMGGGLLGQALGWRSAFFIIGGLGLLLAPLVLLALGPRQARIGPATATQARLPAAGVVQLLKKRSYLLILLASAFIAVGGYAHTTFAPALLVRAHGMTLGSVGVEYGIAMGLSGVIGTLITGRIADRLSSRDPRWLLWTVAAMILVLLPFTTSGYLVENRHLAVGLLSLTMIISTAWMAPVVAAVQRLTPVNQRATASALLLFVSAILGSLGPVAAGMISDALLATHGAKSLGYALLIVPVTHVMAVLLYLLASRSFTAELIEQHD